MHLRRLLPAVAVVVLVPLLIGCDERPERGGGAMESSSLDTTSLTGDGSTASPTPSTGVDSAAPRTLQPTKIARMKTTAGEIVIELYGNDAPKTVENFVKLSERGYYDSLAFHRVAPGFVIQAGDPTSKDLSMRSEWGKHGESAFGGEFEDEVDPTSPSRQRGYVEGAVAMANRGPNTNTSQFFIVLDTQGGQQLLQYNSYTIFGYVRSGLDAVHAIEKQGEGADRPARILSVTIAQP